MPQFADALRAVHRLLGIAGNGGHLSEQHLDAHLLACADVEPPLVPTVRGPHEGVHDIADVDKVPGLETVAIDRHGLTVEHASAEDGDHPRLTPWVLTRPIDVC